jgi:hypothetical protein
MCSHLPFCSYREPLSQLQQFLYTFPNPTLPPLAFFSFVQSGCLTPPLLGPPSTPHPPCMPSLFSGFLLQPYPSFLISSSALSLLSYLVPSLNLLQRTISQSHEFRSTTTPTTIQLTAANLCLQQVQLHEAQVDGRAHEQKRKEMCRIQKAGYEIGISFSSVILQTARGLMEEWL